MLFREDLAEICKNYARPVSMVCFSHVVHKLAKVAYNRSGIWFKSTLGQ